MDVDSIILCYFVVAVGVGGRGLMLTVLLFMFLGCDRIILINSKRFVFGVLSPLRASIDLKLFHLSAQLVKEGLAAMLRERHSARCRIFYFYYFLWNSLIYENLLGLRHK